MKKTIIIITIALNCFIVMAGIAQHINTEKSIVNFQISNMKVKTVKGTFTGMKGTVNFIPSNLATSNFDVCIDVATVNTGNAKRDKHLRTEDFFDEKKYPNICFKSTSVSKTDNGYIVSGSLSMHGITKNVQIPFTFSQNTLKGSLTLKRLDYKIGESTGTFMVGDEVNLEINCILN